MLSFCKGTQGCLQFKILKRKISIKKGKKQSSVWLWMASPGADGENNLTKACPLLPSANDTNSPWEGVGGAAPTAG